MQRTIAVQLVQDRSGHFGPTDRNVPFLFTKLLSPVSYLYPAYKSNNQTRGGGLGRICTTGMFRSIKLMEFPKFQLTGIFVESKAP